MEHSGAMRSRHQMSSEAFWQAEAGEQSCEALRGEAYADIAVIGAGVTGAALALWLARAGAGVAVVESRQIAAGASGRNGGFVLGGTVLTYAADQARYGAALARRIWAFTEANLELTAEVAGELHAQGWPTGYARTGSLRIATSERELDEIHASVGLLGADGWPAELVARADLAPVLQPGYLGGLFNPRDGEFHPVRFVQGLARLACEAGATFYERSPVVALAEEESGVRVTTPAGVLRAQTLVLATNAWLPASGLLLGADWLAGRIVPARGQMLSTAPAAERLFSCPCYADEGYQYWRQLPDGRLVVGGWRNRVLGTESEETIDEAPSDAGQSHLDAFVHDTLGQRNVAIERRWAGIMAFSADGLPLVGRLPGSKRCYLAGGYTGHGNAYALRATQIVAALLDGRTHPDAALFDPARLAVPAKSTASL